MHQRTQTPSVLRPHLTTSRMKCLFLFATVIAFGFGCAHAPKRSEKKIEFPQDPKALLSKACSPGKKIREASGSLKMKAESVEASGQLPASVKAKYPNQLDLEITNPLGGIEAYIKVRGSKYTIQSAKDQSKKQEGYDSWGGIPLTWASDLFLGRIPCPTSSEIKTAKISYGEDEELIVDVPAALHGDKQSFIYRFREHEGAPWPEALTWERAGPFGGKVEFEFDEPEAPSLSPLKWSAKSDRGSVKIRWSERTIQVR